MTPFEIGLLAGFIAASILTVAYHRLRGTAALLALIGTIFVSLLPRVYFSLGAYHGTSADIGYTSAWMVVACSGFCIGINFLGRFLKKKSK